MPFQSKNGTLAVKQPEFKKIEATVKGGIALVSQRIELVSVDLIMDYQLGDTLLKAGVTRILLRGDAGLQPWAKQTLSFDGKEFVLCPESAVVAVQTLG